MTDRHIYVPQSRTEFYDNLKRKQVCVELVIGRSYVGLLEAVYDNSIVVRQGDTVFLLYMHAIVSVSEVLPS
jgi:hypothetical protein